MCFAFLAAEATRVEDVVVVEVPVEVPVQAAVEVAGMVVGGSEVEDIDRMCVFVHLENVCCRR